MENLPLLDALAPIEDQLSDEKVTEIVINTPGVAYYERLGCWHSIKLPVFTERKLLKLATLTANAESKKINALSPILSATWPTGHRVQIVIPPAVRSGVASFTIRSHHDLGLTLERLEGEGYFSHRESSASGARDGKITMSASGMRSAVLGKKTIIISGGTGSGKTSLARVLVENIPTDERLISIENVDEIRLNKSHANSVSLFFGADGVTQQSLLESSLRMRPNRVFLAELIAADEAFSFLTAINTGHPGSITTIHADSAALAVHRLSMMIRSSEGGSGMSREDVREMLRQTVDVIVQVKRAGRNRFVSEIFQWGNE